MAYDKPNYTQIPNLFLDRDLSKITALSELKVTLAVMRNTIGWQEKKAELGIPELIGITGLSRQSVVDGVKLALARGTVKRERSGHTFVYEAHIVRVKKVDSSETGATVNISEQNLDSSGDESLCGSKKEIHTQEISACAPLPNGSGEDRAASVGNETSFPADDLPPASSFVSVGNVLARIGHSGEFDAEASRRKAQAARPPSKGKRPKPVVVDLVAVPEKFYDSMTGTEKRELADRLDFDRGEFEKRVEAWELSRRESDTRFASPYAMRANLRKYLVNCDLNKRRAS